MLRIDCVAQHYKWGRKGINALVASLKKSSDSTFIINDEENYAELWMGTHPSGPSKVKDSTILLSEWLSDKPNAIGKVPTGYPENNLPFLFKVLSVQTALSIQTHPNKALAEQLHAQFPDIYKDDNHKPEMVIALTDFECLCGFAKINELKNNFVNYPELVAVINHSCTVSETISSIEDVEALSQTDESSILEEMFKSLMGCPQRVIVEQLQLLTTRLKEMKDSNTSLSPLEELILRLFDQYGADNGVFCSLVMNYICLKPGDSFFIGANELHAYIFGECVECMALSDNVVRAGLTPKFKDCDTLCKMLHYKSQMPNFLTPLPLDDHTAVYRPPSDCCAEFEVERIQLPEVANSTNEYSLPARPCASILLMVSGGGAMDDDNSERGYSLRLTSSPDAVSPSATKRRSGSISGLLRFFAGSGKSEKVISEQEKMLLSSNIVLHDGSVVFIAANMEATIETLEQGASKALLYRAHVNLGEN